VVDRARRYRPAGGWGRRGLGGRLRGWATHLEVVDVQVHLGRGRHVNGLDHHGRAAVAPGSVAVSGSDGDETGHFGLGEGAGLDQRRPEVV
jgi:hypothetical protein